MNIFLLSPLDFQLLIPMLFQRVIFSLLHVCFTTGFNPSMLKKTITFPGLPSSTIFP
ncbi:hypothetical protein HPG69_008865 [Diceros bicornis minor]|uniref:Uncharacterized protein n=1 Tax=Diceros bicornis minor TaxID=77932 RepID=A0A7J7FB26_DICBM|nr:hypothetical protein HPG69_008865 [Diceros bicornis minor]